MGHLEKLGRVPHEPLGGNLPLLELKIELQGSENLGVIHQIEGDDLGRFGNPRARALADLARGARNTSTTRTFGYGLLCPNGVQNAIALLLDARIHNETRFAPVGEHRVKRGLSRCTDFIRDVELVHCLHAPYL